VGFQFNWALSVFYIAYIMVDIPSNMLLRRFGPRWYLPFLVVCFGLVSIGTAFVRSFAGLATARVFLGIAEGGTMPGLSFFLSTFYKREELLLRIGLYFCSASLAGASGGLLATALSLVPDWGVNGAVILHSWRNIFFFEGLVTVLVGILAPMWMPDSPATAWFLTERERRIAVQRLVSDETASHPQSADHTKVKLDHIELNRKVSTADIRAALGSVHDWTCAFGYFLSNITVQGISLFLPTILSDLRWSSTKAQLLSVPPYAAACVVTIVVALASDRIRQRGVFMAGLAVAGVVGFAVLRWDTQPNIKYMAVYFAMIGAFPGGPNFMCWALNSEWFSS
jgi:MFS family permease